MLRVAPEGYYYCTDGKGPLMALLIMQGCGCVEDLDAGTGGMMDGWLRVEGIRT